MKFGIIIAGLLALGLMQAGAQDIVSAAKPAATYEQWIRQYERATSAAVPYVGSKDAEQNAPLLAIFEVEERPESEGELQRSKFRNASHGYLITQSGRVNSFLRGTEGSQVLSDAGTAKVRDLAANLPEDHAYLPPPGRRLVVQATTAGAATARVYDRANIPDSVLDTIAAIGANDLLPWIYPIRADRSGPIADYPGATVVHQTLSPNGSVAVQVGNSGFGVVDPGSGQLIREVNESFAGGMLDPRFSPDGEYLLVRTTIPSLLIYETGTWHRMGQMPGIPQGATSYWPNSSWNASVVSTSDGSVQLWNGTQSVATLAEKSEIVGVEFSPDDSLVAVATRTRKQEPGAHDVAVSVWHADGTKLSSFRFANFVQPTTEGKVMAWLPDGQHVLSPVKESSATYASMAVWNAQTGRYDTELIGCDGSIRRFVVEAEQVKADCDGRGVYEWNLSSAMKKMGEFEASLK